jgi:hypothetical protein
LKVHLDFPSDYPWQAPAISIEKNAELVPKQRAFLLTGLRNLLAGHAGKGLPTLEAFARFLLGDSIVLDGLDDSSESDNDTGRPHRVNVPLPRRSGAVFGPRNELVAFFPFSSTAVDTEKPKASSTSASLAPSVQRKTLLFDSFGALSKPAQEGGADNSESDEALRLPRLVTSKVPFPSTTNRGIIQPYSQAQACGREQLSRALRQLRQLFTSVRTPLPWARTSNRSWHTFLFTRRPSALSILCWTTVLGRKLRLRCGTCCET